MSKYLNLLSYRLKLCNPKNKLSNVIKIIKYIINDLKAVILKLEQ